MNSLRLKKLLPIILTGLSSVGVVATGYFAHVGTLKAQEILRKKREEEEIEAADWKEELKQTWKCYIPSAACGVVAIGAGIAAQGVNAKNLASVTAAAGVISKAYTSFKEKAREVVGDETVLDIQNRVAEEDLKNGGLLPTVVAHPPAITVGWFTRTDYDQAMPGDELFYDEFTHIWFKSSREAVRNGFYHLNRNWAIGHEPRLIDLYSFWGVDITDLVNNGVCNAEDFENLGWSSENLDGFYWLDFALSEPQTTNTGEQYSVISYELVPDILGFED